jgi:hypothetical protein
MATYKITMRKNAKSPHEKYNTLFGINRTSTGYRVDIPWHSLTKMNPKGSRRMVRSSTSGIRLIVENNRRGKSSVFHFTV